MRVKYQLDYYLAPISKMAEGEGFEPPVPFRYSGFQDRLFQPLTHPSID